MAAKSKTDTADVFTPFFGKEAFETYTKQGKEFFEKTFGNAPMDFDKFSSQWMKSFDEAMAFGQANAQAYLKAGDIWLKGLETVSSTVAATAKEEMETSVSTAKTIMDCKTVQDMVELQTTYAKGRYDKMVDQGSKLGEIVRGVANDAAKPLTERFAANVEAAKAEVTKATAAAKAA